MYYKNKLHQKIMSVLRNLLSGQHIRIDNHQRGKPMKWDWEPEEQPDDIHLDKEMDRRVNGKKVQIRVTLNKDGGVNVPHAKNKKDQAWMNEYNRIKNEVRDVLEHDSDLTKEFVKSVKEAIQAIGPHKDRKAVRKALGRIGAFFGLNAFIIQQMTDEAKGLFCLYSLPQQQFYAAFGYDYAFYFGEGGTRDFHRHSKVTWLWGKLCRDLERCPTLQDLLDYYINGVGRRNTKKGMEEELNFVADVLNKDGISEEKKAETLLVPESNEECPVKRTHLWRLKFKNEERRNAIDAIVRNNLMHRAYSSFDEVMNCAISFLLPLPQIGRLAIYDIAKRIWWAQGYRGVKTDYVVLAQGAYAGARCIVGIIPKLRYKTDKSIFPVELFKLDALYLEDFFCVMKNELEILYNV